MADLSVQQLFETLSINEIQDLKNSYQERAVTARSDLQKLVNDKYRDLISITDDISNTFQATKEESKKLSQLAYKSSHFISFNTSNTSKFYLRHSQRFSDEIDKVKKANDVKILNLVLHDELQRFDLKLCLNQLIHHTAIYVHIGKCYHTIWKRYSSHIVKNHLLNNKYKSMKLNLLKSLELGIAEYNISCKSVYTAESDLFDKSHLFGSRNIISKVHMLEEIELDMNELGVADSILGNNFYDVETHDVCRNNLAILNYLVAYILLESDGYTVSKSQVLFKLLDLRYNHLKRILFQFIHIVKATNAKDITKINFFQIWKFIENTFGYIEQYFESDDDNDLFKCFKAIETWNTDILGFYSYSQPIKFNIDMFGIKLPVSSQNDLKEYKVKFIDLVEQSFQQLIEQAELNLVVPLFVGFASSVKKIEEWANDNGFKALIIEFISLQNTLSTALHSVIGAFSNRFPVFLGQLTDNGDIYKAIKKDLDLETPQEDQSLFNNNLMTLVDDNLSEYFDLLINASLNSSFSMHHDIIKILTNWINQGQEYLNVLDVTQGSLSKFIEYLAESIDDVSVSYGAFSETLVVEEMTKFRTSLIKSSFDLINRFLNELGELQDNNHNNIARCYYILKILITLDHNLPLIIESDKFTTLHQTIMKHSNTIYVKVFQQLPSNIVDGISIDDQLESIILSICNDKSPPTLPSSPSLKLTTLMYHFSSELLGPNSSHTNDYKNGMIFIDVTIAAQFRQVKNQWFKEFVDRKVYEILANSGNTKVFKANVIHLYANIYFLGCFADHTPSLEKLKDYIEEEINTEDVKEIDKSISDFYNNCKNTFFPLNV